MSKPTTPLSLQDEMTEFLLYTAPNGEVKVEVLLNNETLWLTQKRMAALFGVQRPAITRHLKNIFESKELEENSVCSILEHTAEDGKTYPTKYYNLDAVIEDHGKISHNQAEQKAFAEYEKYNKQQRIESDFDRELKKLSQQDKSKDVE